MKLQERMTEMFKNNFVCDREAKKMGTTPQIWP